MSESSHVDEAPVPPPRDPEAAFGTKTPPGLLPRPTLREDDPPGADRLGLTPEEIDQFRESGFLVKRGMIAPQLFEPFH